MRGSISDRRFSPGIDGAKSMCATARHPTKVLPRNRQRESHPEDLGCQTAAVRPRRFGQPKYCYRITPLIATVPNVTHRGAGAEQAQRQLERQFQRLYSRSSERNQKSEQIRKRAESAMAVGGLGAFLGRPIFPIQDRRAWEYWIYPGAGRRRGNRVSPDARRARWRF